MPTLTELRLAYRKQPDTVLETVDEVKTDEAVEKQIIIEKPVKKTNKSKKVKEGEKIWHI